MIALLTRDGTHGCALVGEDLQSGESEFERIVRSPMEPYGRATARACMVAYERLRARLGTVTGYRWGSGTSGEEWPRDAAGGRDAVVDADKRHNVGGQKCDAPIRDR